MAIRQISPQNLRQTIPKTTGSTIARIPLNPLCCRCLGFSDVQFGKLPRTSPTTTIGTKPTTKKCLRYNFGGLREAVLERDGYRCRVCDASGRDKRSIIVHHRRPGQSVLNLMLSLCPGCHAKVHRTKAVLSAMPPLLLELWREQHRTGHEQVQLDFTSKKPAAKLVPLFGDERGPGR